MQYKYDSHNRMKSIIYPDGEVVSDHYNPDGDYKCLWMACLTSSEMRETVMLYKLYDYTAVQYPEKELYFYHSDHLGSASWITDSGGKAIQHLQYMPFGERLISQSVPGNNWYTRYLFSAKEMDEESRYSYFGARYYNSDLSIWLSVDPRASSYPGLTPYNYCANSPVMYTDPNGESLKWWQGLLIGLGIDVLTGGALTATGFTITTTASAVAFGASTTLSSVDFGVSFVRSIVTGNDQSMQNWFNMEVGRLTSFTSMFSYDKTAKGIEWPLQVFNNLTGGEFLQDQVGNTFGHALNIGGKITASGFYDHRLILRTPKNTLNTAISFGHYIYGDNIALSPNDYSQGTDGLDLLAHEYGHTYQSRIMGPMYLFRVGIASVYDNNGLTETDADRRGFRNLGITPSPDYDSNFASSTYKWYEFFGAPMLWPFMWMWNY